MPSSSSYTTENGAPGTALAFTTWSMRHDEQGIVSHRASAHHAEAPPRECMAEPPSPIHTFCRPAFGPNESNLPILDRHGSPLWAGARVRLRAIDDGRLPFVSEGHIIKVNRWKQAEVQLAQPRTKYIRLPGSCGVSTHGTTHAFTFGWSTVTLLANGASHAAWLRDTGTRMLLDTLENSAFWLELADDPRLARRR